MKGILFTELMFKAIIEGRKTQTRRIVKLPANAFGFNVCRRKIDGVFTGVYAYDADERTIKPGTEKQWQILPRYKVGETVYLKEPYIDDIAVEKIFYKFDKSDRQEAMDCGFDYGWKNKLFMPESCARNFIKITDIRCERIDTISERDCIAEGIFKMIDPIGIPGFGYDKKDHGFMWSHAKEAYKALWCSINGGWSWEMNPFVFVYEFQLL